MAAIGEPVLRFEQHQRPLIDRCCDRITQIIRRVVIPLFESLARFFMSVLCCLRFPPRVVPVVGGNLPPRLEIDEEEGPGPIPVIPVRIGPQVPPVVAEPAPGGQAVQAIEIPPMPAAPDLPRLPGHDAALGRCQRYLRGEAFIAPGVDSLNQLSARDFIALYNDFPGHRPAIIQWSIDAVQARDIRIDPNHPYFEMFEAFLQNKGNYGGAGESGNYRNYAVAADYSGRGGREYYNGVSRFVYTIYSLIGFQELTREENRVWLRMIDNGGATFDANPAYRYGRALSKMFTYPTRPDNIPWNDPRPPMDIRDKIHHGINAPWIAYSTARFMREVPQFFQTAFGGHGYNEHCFDARISAMQRFLERYLAVPDFTPDIGLRHGNDHRTLEHYRVAKNLKIAAFARAQNLDYQEAKHWIGGYGADGIPPAHLRFARDLEGRLIDEARRVQINAFLHTFHRDYFQPADFERYLAQAGQPLKQMIPVYDVHERRMVRKPQGPALQRQPREEDGLRFEGWEPILRDSGMWPDHWDAPEAQQPAV